MIIDDIARELDGAGFFIRGGFKPEIGDDVPILADGRVAKSLIMIGNAGPAMWGKFTEQRPGGDDPLDHWTQAVLRKIADRFSALAVFPFQRPYLPFQRWLAKAEGCHFSPLGLVVHPEFGLWHAVRGALLLGEDIGIAPKPSYSSPCVSCADRPCMKACPVQAFTPGGHDMAACLAHLTSTAGEDCMALGCRARWACPVGHDYRYSPDETRFHMEALRSTLRRQRD